MMLVNNLEPLHISSPAKLNLFLHIVGRREDGYHELQTVFQLTDFCDTLTFSLREDNSIVLHTDLPLPNEKNLIWQAAKILQPYAKCQKGVTIDVVKRIPLGGGLGGASSNAATTLLALNKLWQTGLDTEILANLGQQLGADVSVFVRGHSAFAEGIGEKLTPMALPETWFLLLMPVCQVETKALFAHHQLQRDMERISLDDYQPGFGCNVFEPIVRVLYPEIDQALCWLGQFAHAKLTGSGSTVFASFATREEAEKIAKITPKSFATVLARGINTSPVHQALNIVIKRESRQH